MAAAGATNGRAAKRAATGTAAARAATGGGPARAATGGTARPAAPGPIVVAAAAGLVVNLDTMVNIALPAIGDAFAVDVAAITWLVVCYVLTYACLLVTTGRLADAFGHERVLRLGLALTALGLLGAGAAPSWSLFLLARVVQGAGAALALGAAPALATTAVGPADRAAALGRFQLGVAAGLALGPPLGGALVELAGWRWVFLARAPVAAALLAAVILRHPGDRRAPAPDRTGPASAASGPASAASGPGSAARGPASGTAGPRARPTIGSLDLAGTLSLGGAVAGGLLALNRGGQAGWASPAVLAGVVVLVVLGPLWVHVERRAEAPALDPRLFRSAGFTVANVLNAVANAAMFSIWLLAPYYFVTVMGHGPIVGGVLLAANPLATAVAAPLAGRWSTRVGAGRLACAGLALEACGLAAISRLGAGSPAVVAALALGSVGLGVGLFAVPNLSLVMGAIARDRQGVAGGLTQMARTVGVVGGVALGSLGLTAARRREGDRLGVAATDPATFLGGFRTVFVVAALVCAAAAVLSLTRVRDREPLAS